MNSPLIRPATAETLNRYAEGAQQVAQLGISRSNSIKGEFPVLTLHLVSDSRDPEIPDDKALFSLTFPKSDKPGVLLRFGLVPVTSLIAGFVPYDDKIDPEDFYKIFKIKVETPLNIVDSKADRVCLKHRLGKSFYLEVERIDSGIEKITFASFSTDGFSLRERHSIISYKIPVNAKCIEDIYPPSASEQELKFAIDLITGFSLRFSQVAKAMREAGRTLNSNHLMM